MTSQKTHRITFSNDKSTKNNFNDSTEKKNVADNKVNMNLEKAEEVPEDTQSQGTQVGPNQLLTECCRGRFRWGIS
jgi:hypothetical protein